LGEALAVPTWLNIKNRVVYEGVYAKIDCSEANNFSESLEMI